MKKQPMLLLITFLLLGFKPGLAKEAETQLDTTQEISSLETRKTKKKSLAKAKTKDWNFMVYIAGNNDLHRFSIHNLKQMLKVGSTDSINIIVQFDEYSKREVTRYYVEREHLVVAGSQSNSAIATSGTPESLYDFVSWSTKNYKARHQALVLWNHGYGIKDPSIWGRTKILERDKLFTINYQTGLLELNREEIPQDDQDEEEIKRFVDERGIAFNDTAQEYLTNQDLTNSLSKMCNNLFGGNRIDILFMDACHMGMVEIGSQVKDYVNYMVASEEVEPGTGYNYIYLLTPFLSGSLSPAEFACQGVRAYEEEYKFENADYTQSAIDLYNYGKLEFNIKAMSETLCELLDNNDSSKIMSILKKIRTRSTYTTSFYDPEYIDFCHFYRSLSELLREELYYETYSTNIQRLLENARDLAEQGLGMMQNYIIKNASGINLPYAYGLAFYFPTRRVHKSYYKTIFDQETGWSAFLEKYIYLRQR